MGILTKKELNDRLCEYYKERFGNREPDINYDQPAVNVWVFGIEGKLITLKCHILNGTVEEFCEDIPSP